ncbi:hypothetical protein PDJAM_G00151080 [Pangasius djambal]|uniref:Uncharacterized protein n=1 Tax=Pangasius djambal TaxID=1691987 RepID=A0ACC5ZGE7_9TELE|nr:hypothetical protein [Pangasius djambal]
MWKPNNNSFSDASVLFGEKTTCLIAVRVDDWQGLDLDKDRTGAQSQPAATSFLTAFSTIQQLAKVQT